MWAHAKFFLKEQSPFFKNFLKKNMRPGNFMYANTKWWQKQKALKAVEKHVYFLFKQKG